MNRRIKKKKVKQWIEKNGIVKVTCSAERLDNGYCKLYAIITAGKGEHEQQKNEHGSAEE